MTIQSYHTPISEWHPILTPLENAVDGAQASLDRLDGTLAVVRGALASQGVICDIDFDLAMGDMHVLTPEEQWEAEEGTITDLELRMLDSCLEACHSEAEAGGLMLTLEERGIHVRPALCPSCLGWHLERGR